MGASMYGKEPRADRDGVTMLPCPFCGYPAEEGQIADGDDAGGHFIQCTNGMCGVSTPLQFSCGEDARPLLRERWNNRKIRY